MASIAATAGTGGVQNFNTGTVTFATPSSATGAIDGTFAASGAQGASITTDSLDLWNFGLSLPSGQTVVGIQADYWARRTQVSARGNSFNSVRIEIGGAVGSPTVVPSLALNTTAGTFTFGGPTDLWGLSATLTQSNINSNVKNTGPTLGAWFTSASGGASSCTAGVDSVTLTIYYSPAGGAATGGLCLPFMTAVIMPPFGGSSLCIPGVTN